MTTAATNIRYLRYVSYRDIPAYLQLGWIAEEPATFDRLSWYGISMAWCCDCPVPDLRKEAA